MLFLNIHSAVCRVQVLMEEFNPDNANQNASDVPGAFSTMESMKRSGVGFSLPEESEGGCLCLRAR